MTTTKIEWADSVWNPIVGCTPISPGCLNCYAARQSMRMHRMGTRGYEPRDGVRIAEVRFGRPVFTGDVRFIEQALKLPFTRRKPTTWFVNSMSDLWHESLQRAHINEVLNVIMDTPRHHYIALTKRPRRAAEHSAEREFPANLCVGASAEDQRTYRQRMPWLRGAQARLRCLSLEPLLGPIDLLDLTASDVCMVIAGGESGPDARPCDINWLRSLRDQCAERGIPYFCKQLGRRPVHDCPPSTGLSCLRCGMATRVRDPKGANQAEWPTDLRGHRPPWPWVDMDETDHQEWLRESERKMDQD